MDGGQNTAAVNFIGIVNSLLRMATHALQTKDFQMGITIIEIIKSIPVFADFCEL